MEEEQRGTTRALRERERGTQTEAERRRGEDSLGSALPRLHAGPHPLTFPYGGREKVQDRAMEKPER